MRTPIILALFAMASPPALARAQETDTEWLQNCRSKRWSSDREQVCDVEVKTIPARSMLNVRPGQNGAVKIEAYNGRDIEIHARMQANADSRGEAQELMREINIETSGPITASGRESGRRKNWHVSFYIFVPRNTNVDVITQNGPISIKNVIGKMALSAQNGPISLDGVGGDVHARAENGPLHVRLTGTRWTGEGLDAETHNGPLALEIPENYNAALETGTINGPVETDFPINVTLNGRRGWRHFTTTLGRGGPSVRAVTTNGPLSLRRP
ncbi:MAG TPA: hypothetical protein VM100_12455 [Longimicrobiales bacterium]|nr:hypothetical protein [Longimicrobiales bacterium]